MMFVQKKYLVKAMQLDEDFELETIGGRHYGHKGDYLITNADGEQLIVSKGYFEENFVAVIVLNSLPKKADKSFAEEYERQAYEFYCTSKSNDNEAVETILFYNTKIRND